MRELRSIGAAAVILMASAPVGATRAAEVCVVCTGPEAMYRCVVDTGLPEVTPAVRMLCVSNIAGDGKHETCAVSRTIGLQACNGPERHVKAAPLGPPPVASAPLAPLLPTDPLKQPAPSQPPQPTEGGDSPATVQDLARQMTKSTGEQVEKAGSAISGAARKTWGCVSSFFKAC